MRCGPDYGVLILLLLALILLAVLSHTPRL